MAATIINRRLGGWLGLFALALQLAFAPVLSIRALAMAIDPLTDVEFCLSSANSQAPVSGSSQPSHPSHCDVQCMTACASYTPSLLAQTFFDLAALGWTEEPLDKESSRTITAPVRLDLQIRAPPFP